MLITAAYAQAAGAGPFGASDTLVQLVPIVAMIAIVYFVLWRPQQRRAKEQREMVQAARRGDVVVTTPSPRRAACTISRCSFARRCCGRQSTK